MLLYGCFFIGVSAASSEAVDLCVRVVGGLVGVAVEHSDAIWLLEGLLGGLVVVAAGHHGPSPLQVIGWHLLQGLDEVITKGSH